MHFAQSFLFFEANELPAAQACQAPRVARGPKIHPAEVDHDMPGDSLFHWQRAQQVHFFFLFRFFFLRTKFIIFFFTEDVGALRETFQVFVGFLGMEHVFFFVFHLPICEAKTSAMKAGSGSTVLENSRAGRRFSRIYGLGKLGIQSCKSLRECKSWVTKNGHTSQPAKIRWIVVHSNSVDQAPTVQLKKTSFFNHSVFFPKFAPPKPTPPPFWHASEGGSSATSAWKDVTFATCRRRQATPRRPSTSEKR